MKFLIQMRLTWWQNLRKLNEKSFQVAALYELRWEELVSSKIPQILLRFC